MKYEIICGHWTTHADGVKTALFLGKDEKGLFHVLAGDKKTSLKLIEPSGTSYATIEDKIDWAFEECEEMIYSCIISNGKRYAE